jgi:hypothetical protein
MTFTYKALSVGLQLSNMFELCSINFQTRAYLDIASHEHITFVRELEGADVRVGNHRSS